MSKERVEPKKLAFRVAYIGTEFQGFHRQREGVRTVENELRKALYMAKMIEDSKTPSLEIAARTDRGVSALEQTIALPASPKDIPLAAINSFLPTTIRIWARAEVPSDFHPRRSPKMRTYTYFLYDYDLDLDKMRESMEILLGTHDFGNFSKYDRKRPNQTRVRNLMETNLLKNGDILEVSFSANSFLWQMVRRLVSHLIAVGKGERGVSSTKTLLNGPSVVKPPPAPPQYLLLESIDYAVKFKKNLKVITEFQKLLEKQLQDLELTKNITNRIFERFSDDSA